MKCKFLKFCLVTATAAQLPPFSEMLVLGLEGEVLGLGVEGLVLVNISGRFRSSW